jgi:alpha-ketoglutarate-dependent taurine dioxygenase
MASVNPRPPAAKPLGPRRRRTIALSEEQLVEVRAADGELPVTIHARDASIDAAEWAAQNRDLVESHLLTSGAVCFRNFALAGAEAFDRFVRVFASELLSYTYGSTPRRRAHGDIYTSTEYPPDQSIPFHNEMSYSRSWPMKIWFFCATPAASGGETPLADSRRVLERIDPEIVETFAAKGVMYVRNYGLGIDLSWQQAFETPHREEVETFCRASGIAFEWLDGDRLRTRQTCQGVQRHPVTGESVWFNQAHLFHPSGLPAETRDALLTVLGEDALPRNVLFGDDSKIADDDLDKVREAYRAEMVDVDWQRGDVLLVDNMLVAHGRSPYRGARRILTAMGDAYTPTPN